jgi:NADPH:quinone reductase-like Zn-dependent oxidoreductase
MHLLMCSRNRASANVHAAVNCRADYVINESEEDIVTRVKDITGGEGAYAALDPIAGDFTGTVSPQRSPAQTQVHICSTLAAPWSLQSSIYTTEHTCVHTVLSTSRTESPGQLDR